MAVGGQRQHPVAFAHAGLLRHGAGRRRGDDRRGFAHAAGEQREVQHDRQQEIGQRPGGDDDEALADRLAVERARQVGRIDPGVAFGIELALVQHLHVAAQRDGRHRPLGAVAALRDPAQQRPPETDRKAQHLHAAGARGEVMPHLVHVDEYAQGNNESEYGLHGVGTSVTVAGLARRIRGYRQVRGRRNRYCRRCGRPARRISGAAPVLQRPHAQPRAPCDRHRGWRRACPPRRLVLPEAPEPPTARCP
ncbi:hypothetical protein D9M68_622910 [compost metagenome]